MFAERQASKIKVPETISEGLVVAEVMAVQGFVNVSGLAAFLRWVNAAPFEYFVTFGTCHKPDGLNKFIRGRGVVVKAVLVLKVLKEIIFSMKDHCT